MLITCPCWPRRTEQANARPCVAPAHAGLCALLGRRSPTSRCSSPSRSSCSASARPGCSAAVSTTACKAGCTRLPCATHARTHAHAALPTHTQGTHPHAHPHAHTARTATHHVRTWATSDAAPPHNGRRSPAKLRCSRAFVVRPFAPPARGDVRLTAACGSFGCCRSSRACWTGPSGAAGSSAARARCACTTACRRSVRSLSLSSLIAYRDRRPSHAPRPCALSRSSPNRPFRRRPLARDARAPVLRWPHIALRTGHAAARALRCLALHHPSQDVPPRRFGAGTAKLWSRCPTLCASTEPGRRIDLQRHYLESTVERCGLSREPRKQSAPPRRAQATAPRPAGPSASQRPSSSGGYAQRVRACVRACVCIWLACAGAI